jgi:hypothetical protein
MSDQPEIFLIEEEEVEFLCYVARRYWRPLQTRRAMDDLRAGEV